MPGDRTTSELADRLTEWARTRDRRERSAVAALVEDGSLLERDDLRASLLTASCDEPFVDWSRFESRYHLLDLDDSERAFLTLVVAIAFPRSVALYHVEFLGDHRLAIVLRALTSSAGSDTIAVGTRT
ncbi:hypothetical protein [Streptomyces uncialis]|uniref:hypothetical protein n=1 Tax=Streptomyces uncialis TaxID=1048205 RepID=UPI00386DA566|nr:hypothetical protein OG268_18275 [Streptomyces uncialis]